MKVLTLTQPWATLVAIGAKRIETRSWFTKYRGPLGIHAAKSFPNWAKQYAQADGYCASLLEDHYFSLDDLPLGVIIAVCTMTKCVPTENLAASISAQEFALGDYSSGRWAWVLSDIQRLIHPIPARGALGLWEWEPGPDWERALGVEPR